MAVHDMVPPAEQVFVGMGDFLEVGNQFLKFFIEVGGLQPYNRVLDVGCGIGRMAVPLTQYLEPPGKYEGFDVVASGIQWCQEKITPRYPHFRFQLVEIRNQHYRPDGRIRPARFRFPFPDASFDFVFLTSVFTHMLPEDVANYLYEVSRVLRRGGKSFITYFLMNEEAAALVGAKKSSLDFRYERGSCFSTNLEVPEQAISHDETVVRNLYRQCGLAIHLPILFGSWCERPRPFHYQDFIVATKVAAPRRRWLPRWPWRPRRFRPVLNWMQRDCVAA